MRLCLSVPVVALSVALAASPAMAFFSQNSLVVVDEGNGTFNVPFRGKSGDPEFWCAAGDYVIRGLGMPVSTRIFRLSEPPRRQGQGIRFSLNPEGAASRTGVAVFTTGPTGSISATLAQSFCPQRIPRNRQ